MKNLLARIWKDDSGQDMVEYALIAGLVSVVAFASLQATGTSLSGIWSTISTDLNTAN